MTSLRFAVKRLFVTPWFPLFWILILLVPVMAQRAAAEVSVPAPGYVIEGVPVGEGLVSEMTPMMRYINRYADYIDTNLKMSSKSRMLVRRGSGISKKDLADWDNDLIEGNSVVQGEDWNWMQHAPFNAMIVNQMASFQNDMKQMEQKIILA